MYEKSSSEKRHADTVQNAMLIGRIATGEVEDAPSKAPNRAKGGKTVHILWRFGSRCGALRKCRPQCKLFSLAPVSFYWTDFLCRLLQDTKKC